MAKIAKNIFTRIQDYEEQIASLEERLLKLEERMNQLINLNRSYIIRVKNHEELPDDFIFSGKKYFDLSPDKAWKIYTNPDSNFILIDVSAKDFSPKERIPEAVQIPWEEFKDKCYEVVNKTTPILIICEDGLTSIKACEFLSSKGFYNCNNISGGYKFWKGFQNKDIRSA
jgi:rhodanese-related sulfurtransferase